MWTCFKVLLEPHVSEEEFGVAVQGGHDIRRGDDLADVDELVAKSVGAFVAPNVKEWIVEWNAACSQLV